MQFIEIQSATPQPKPDGTWRTGTSIAMSEAEQIFGDRIQKPSRLKNFVEKAITQMPAPTTIEHRFSNNRFIRGENLWLGEDTEDAEERVLFNASDRRTAALASLALSSMNQDPRYTARVRFVGDLVVPQGVLTNDQITGDLANDFVGFSRCDAWNLQSNDPQVIMVSASGNPSQAWGRTADALSRACGDGLSSDHILGFAAASQDLHPTEFTRALQISEQQPPLRAAAGILNMIEHPFAA